MSHVYWVREIQAKIDSSNSSHGNSFRLKKIFFTNPLDFYGMPVYFYDKVTLHDSPFSKDDSLKGGFFYCFNESQTASTNGLMVLVEKEKKWVLEERLKQNKWMNKRANE